MTTTARTAETVAAEIKAWDCRAVFDLRALITELTDLVDPSEFEAYVDMSALPTAPIPDDIDTSWPVWAVDQDGYALTGDTATEIQRLVDICAAQRA